MTIINADTGKTQLDWKRILFILIGLTLFAIVNFSPAWPDAVDPTGKHFVLSAQGKGALAIFLLAGTWWVFEVVPIGVTSLALGAFQVLFAVRTAKEALKPDAVRSREQGKKGKQKKRLRRKTDVFKRQGEWFFIPAPDVKVNEKMIFTSEPISRGRGKPHMVEKLYREGGTTVYVCSRHPNGLTTDEYRKLLKKTPEASKWGWRTMARNPVVYVRGKIWHPDHATIRLDAEDHAREDPRRLRAGHDRRAVRAGADRGTG